MKNEKNNLEANEIFLQYEEEMVNNPAYHGMPDLRFDDGSIQWETPSNRKSGHFKFSHDKRYQWWINKAEEVGISPNENKWISKVAKKIHPTKLHPCKICGRVMDIRYCYLSKNFINRVNKLPFYKNDINMTEITHILDFLSSFTDIYQDLAYQSLPSLLECAQIRKIPSLPNKLNEWTNWINNVYIPLEPSMLGPGTMSNAPDRLDGFHTYNRCCRPTADKGRSKENLASYSTDRRAFENWSDGNWITANKLMGYIDSNAVIRQEPCANQSDGMLHPRPCNADHIGPISLGFSHRPEFQLLCTSCNSSKNNRMYYSDVIHLINEEKKGINVTTWYATSIWDKCKNKVTDRESALKLSRVMRDNRNVALQLLAEILKKGHYLFLLSLMNLQYADYKYTLIEDSVSIQNQIVKAKFLKSPSSLQYVTIQKTRKILVAINSLLEYAEKDNRNGYNFTNDEIQFLKNKLFTLLENTDIYLKEKNDELINALSNKKNSEKLIKNFLSSIDYNKILNYKNFIESKEILKEIMDIVAENISSEWFSPRYSRDNFN